MIENGENRSDYIAHKTEDGRVQTIQAHSTGVSNLAENFADAFGAAPMGRIMGAIHDAGKYSEEFQNYIKNGGYRGQVDHSTAGMKLAWEKNLGHAAFGLAGHHAGLTDLGTGLDASGSGTLYGRWKKKIPQYRKAFEAENDVDYSLEGQSANAQQMNPKFGGMFFARMLFSCLVDADYLDTENFMKSQESLRDGFAPIEKLKTRLDQFVAKFEPPHNALNRKRCEILHQCIQCADTLPAGLFTLTVPTGGGKTIASMAFALHHAVKQGMKRVIYVIPYTSIIEQNARVFEEMLGEENVVEHHMNVEYDVGEEQSISLEKRQELERKRLATENWDAPIIVTTNVQFFESLFSNKPSRCRKLHNIANSVLIFDEAQMLPTKYLLPCVRAIKELVQSYRCSAVLCTATQPALNPYFSRGKQELPLEVKEICRGIEEMFTFFKRAEVVQRGEMEKEALLMELSRQEQVLCIVNTKKLAQDLYQSLRKMDEKNVYHLSTFLCPKHRKEKLQKIKENITKSEPCRVISTSLIEAGVDLDFPTVYREMTGLDSVIQAAGRCNREGKRRLEESKVYVFTLKEMKNARWMREEREITESVGRRYEDIASLEAIQAYFNQFHLFEDENLDQKGILKLINGDKVRFPFRQIAAKFILIEELTRPIFIPYDQVGKELETRLRNGERSRSLLRHVGQYCVNVYTAGNGNDVIGKQPFERLFAHGKIEKLDETINILTDMNLYDESMGLLVDLGEGAGVFF